MNWDINTEEGMANAVAWTERLVEVMADKGTWGVPRSGTMVTIDKTTKTATITSLLPDPSIAEVFRAMNWHVKEA